MKKNKLAIGRVRKLTGSEESDMEVYYRFYLGEIVAEDLTDTQQKKLLRYRKAWSWLCMGRTKSMVINTLTKDHEISIRQAEYDYLGAQLLHGKLDAVDKDGRRVASREYYEMLSQLAVKEKQYDIAIKARKEADILAGVYDQEEEGWDPDAFKKPSKVVYVTQVIVQNSEEKEILEEEGSAEVIELDV